MQDFRMGLLNATVAEFNEKEDVWEATVANIPFKFWLDFEEDTVLLRIVGPSSLDRYVFFNAFVVRYCIVYTCDRRACEKGLYFKDAGLLTHKERIQEYKNSPIVIYDAGFDDCVYIPGFPEYFEKKQEACKGKVNSYLEDFKKRWQETGQYEAMRDKRIHDDQVAEIEHAWDDWEKRQRDENA